MDYDTLLARTLQLSRWVVRLKRRKLEYAMRLGWNAQVSLQLDRWLFLEEGLNELSAKAVAA